MKKVAIFASGAGTNAEKIIKHFKDNETGIIALVVSNKIDAGVVGVADEQHIPTLIIQRQEFSETENLLEELQRFQIDFIVLAGFLWLVPKYLIRAYPDRIINIHPALLPEFGGKGMYGMHVHKAVIEAGKKESGISIHYVNERFDEGEIIFQTRCKLDESETPESLANKVHQLEHTHFSAVIENLLKEKWD